MAHQAQDCTCQSYCTYPKLSWIAALGLLQLAENRPFLDAAMLATALHAEGCSSSLLCSANVPSKPDVWQAAAGWDLCYQVDLLNQFIQSAPVKL
jgi:hypothetical protein